MALALALETVYWSKAFHNGRVWAHWLCRSDALDHPEFNKQVNRLLYGI